MRGFAKVIILVPLALLAVAFAVGNRGNVSLSFDPFSDTPYTVDVPLFIVVFAALILGVLIGGIATWLGQGRHRKAARMHRRDVERLRSDLDRMRGTSSAP
ncbi:MAG TPA: LapA family protein [Beijerinckiaceae bacterium]|jgi:uncharacterized integral membrane protein|nr:LapA family protein [Beijerinckiaceae bacterium]